MVKYYKNGFYEDYVDNAVEITDEYWQELLSGQSLGKIIVPDSNGYPILKEVEHIITKEFIAEQRKVRYENETDSLRDDYLEALARGDENAQKIGTEWIIKKDEIRNSLPYPTE